MEYILPAYLNEAINPSLSAEDKLLKTRRL